jgi:hypothetical protein
VGGLLAGLIDGWGEDATVVAAVYGLSMVAAVLLGREAPAEAIADIWDDLSGRERREVLRSLWTGKAPHEAKLARVARRARREEDPGSSPISVHVAAAAAVCGSGAVVFIAASNGAPPGWVAAGAILPLGIAAREFGPALLRAARPV